MAIAYKIWEFPALAIKSQVFHVPGAGIEGGYTTGGARIMSPEPGGRAMLEVQLSLQVNEWDTPYFSWLMSKLNGEIFRIPLAQTPQLAKLPNVDIGNPTVQWEATGMMPDNLWDNDQPWISDGEPITVATEALAGENIVHIGLSGLGQIFHVGHVIGFGNYAHIIDDIVYDGDEAMVTIKPPLRTDIISNDSVYTRPFFTGVIANAEEFRSDYDNVNQGYIQPGKMILLEAIVNV